MIIRANRSQSRFKGQQHRKFQGLIQDLQRQNKDLRVQLVRMEQRLLQAQVAKRKYKTKYRQAKQKIEILGLVRATHKASDPYDLCLSPKTKTTRIKTISEEEFNSIKHGFGSDLEDQIQTKVEIDHYQTHFSSKKGNTAPSTLREIEQQKEKDSHHNEKILENLVRLHEQLEKLSVQIQQRPKIEERVVALETQLYRKMEEVVEKVSRLELRDIERENKRISHEKERASRKHIQSMKTIQMIGKDLLQFKVAE